MSTQQVGIVITLRFLEKDFMMQSRLLRQPKDSCSLSVQIACLVGRKTGDFEPHGLSPKLELNTEKSGGQKHLRRLTKAPEQFECRFAARGGKNIEAKTGSAG